MDDEIMKKMADYEQSNVKVTLNDGKTLKGFIDVFETRYDNDGEASICFAADDGEMLIIEESEIKEIAAA